MLKNSRDNKKRKLSLICTFLMLIIVFSIIGVTAYSTCTDIVDRKNSYDIETNLLVKDKKVDNINNDLQPQRKINLLDFDANVVAEYIEFKNELNEYAGYVIRDTHSGYIYDYSNEGNLFEGLLSKSGLTYEDLYEGKVYFVNPFEIYVELKNGEIIDLMPESGIYSSTITKNELEETFSERKVEFGRTVEPELKKLKVSESTFAKRSYFTPCVTDDFDDMKITDSKGRRVYPHDHCSPTAATTIMKYFKYLGKSSLSNSYSNNDVFAKFYIAMDTNGGVSGSKDSGTVRSKIAPSYIKVGRDLNAKPKDSSKLSGTSSKIMQSELERGKLLHVSVDTLGSKKGGHSIAVVSYSNGYFEIADGWSASFRNVAYSDMNVKQVVAVNY